MRESHLSVMGRSKCYNVFFLTYLLMFTLIDQAEKAKENAEMMSQKLGEIEKR